MNLNAITLAITRPGMPNGVYSEGFDVSRSLLYQEDFYLLLLEDGEPIAFNLAAYGNDYPLLDEASDSVLDQSFNPILYTVTA